MRFTKMHGIGNDYVYVNLFTERVTDAPALARAVSRPHYGVGSDGLILIGPGERAPFRMTVYNADGSRAKMCGNGARCVGKYLFDRGMAEGPEILLETDAGVRTLRVRAENGRAAEIETDMGAPQLTFEEVPCLLGSGTVRPVPVESRGRVFSALPLGMGNPHAVVFLDGPEDCDPARYGEEIGANPGFPEGANVEFVYALGEGRLRMRVFERGSGVTMACGTGACAALAAAVLLGRAPREAEIVLDGGTLACRWDEATGRVFLRGPAAFVFEGEWPDA